MALQITSASALLPGKTGKRENCIFHLNVVVLGHRQNTIQPVAVDFFNLFHSQLILTLLYDSLNLVINTFSSELLGGMIQEKGSQKRCSSWTVLHAQCTSALSSGFPLMQGRPNAQALDR